MNSGEKWVLQPGRNDVGKGGHLRMKAFVESVLELHPFLPSRYRNNLHD